MPRTRGNGDGSIEVRDDGKGRVRVKINGKRKQIGPWYDSEKIAIANLNAWKAKAAEGAIIAPNAVTFGSYGEEWLQRRELSGRIRGIAEEVDRWRAHVKSAPFYDTALDAITRRDVADWIDELLITHAVTAIRGPDGTTLRREASRTLSRGTVTQVLRLVKSVLRDAVERDALERSVAADVRVPAKVRDEDLEDAWTHLEQHEIDALLSCTAIDEWRRMLFTVAIFTGVRRGELFALRWADVHEEDALRPRIVVRKTKNGRIREIPLFAPARAALRRLREISGDELLVFTNDEGKPFGEHYRAGWADKAERKGPADKDGNPTLRVVPGAKTKAGITRDVRFHDLRHTCASHLVMGTWGRSWSLEEVRAVLGHSTITMTQRYAHLAPDALHAAARTTATNVIPLPRVAPSQLDATSLSALENSDGRKVDRTPDRRRVKAQLCH